VSLVGALKKKARGKNHIRGRVMDEKLYLAKKGGGIVEVAKNHMETLRDKSGAGREHNRRKKLEEKVAKWFGI